MLVVEEKEKRIVNYRAGMCYQKKAEEIDEMKNLGAEKRMEMPRNAFIECLEKAKKSILKK